jgi:SPP1 family predicted phage head-tail adaptor
MRQGQLDRRAEIIGSATTRNEYNEAIEAAAVLATVMCRLQEVSGREFVAAAQPFAEQRAVITIRYRTGIDTKSSLRVDGKNWNIRSIREIGRRRYLELAATHTG